MELTAVAEFLNSFFSGFDHFILEMLHNFAVLTSNHLTWLFKLITFLGEKGLIFILFSIFLMLFKKTRKVGICMFGAIGFGAILTNFIIKDMVARPRPFMSDVLEYKEWWQYIGSVAEDEFSFPSGHTTAITAALMTIFAFTKSKKRYIVFLLIVLMGISRNYLMAHYPSDILGGVLIGLISMIVAFYITKLIYYILDKYENKFFDFIKTFDIVDFIKKSKNNN